MIPLVTASEAGKAHPESFGVNSPLELWGLDRIFFNRLFYQVFWNEAP